MNAWPWLSRGVRIGAPAHRLWMAAALALSRAMVLELTSRHGRFGVFAGQRACADFVPFEATHPRWGHPAAAIAKVWQMGWRHMPMANARDCGHALGEGE